MGTQGETGRHTALNPKGYPPFQLKNLGLAYLARYTHRVAISNSRLLAAGADGVTFKYKDYRVEGVALQDHDARPARVHPPLSDACAATRLPPHPPLRALGQWRRAENIAKARELLAVLPVAQADAAGTAEKADPEGLRVLPRRHRGLRPRLRATVPAARRGARLGRYVMMPLSPFPNRNIDRDCCWAWPGRAGARLKKRHGCSKPATCPPASDGSRRRTPLPAPTAPSKLPPVLALLACAATGVPSNPHSPLIGCGTRVPCTPRFRALALFGRLPSACADGSVMQASENLHKGGIALVRSEKTALRTRSRLGDPLQGNGRSGLPPGTMPPIRWRSHKGRLVRSAAYAGGAGAGREGGAPSHLPLAARPAIRVPWVRLRWRSYRSHCRSR